MDVRYAILLILLAFATTVVAQENKEVPASGITSLYNRSGEVGVGQLEGVNKEYRSPMAVKTNLLFDLATLLNVELEYRLSPRWSIMAEGNFSWWNIDQYKYSLHTNFGLAELRYYMGSFGKRPATNVSHWSQTRPHGWFVGVHAGVGRFGLTYPSEGYMGDLVVAAGLSVGFTHSISRIFSMEYCVGAGYVRTDYQYFLVKDGGKQLLWQHDARFQGVMPTRAKVSLVWWPQFKRKKGGVQ